MEGIRISIIHSLHCVRDVICGSARVPVRVRHPVPEEYISFRPTSRKWIFSSYHAYIYAVKLQSCRLIYISRKAKSRQFIHCWWWCNPPHPPPPPGPYIRRRSNGGRLRRGVLTGIKQALGPCVRMYVCMYDPTRPTALCRYVGGVALPYILYVPPRLDGAGLGWGSFIRNIGWQ